MTERAEDVLTEFYNWLATTPIPKDAPIVGTLLEGYRAATAHLRSVTAEKDARIAAGDELIRLGQKQWEAQAVKLTDLTAERDRLQTRLNALMRSEQWVGDPTGDPTCTYCGGKWGDHAGNVCPTRAELGDEHG